jgi:phospholipase C
LFGFGLNSQRIGGGSFDATTGSINDLFDFTTAANTAPLTLDPTSGAVVTRTKNKN